MDYIKKGLLLGVIIGLMFSGSVLAKDMLYFGHTLAGDNPAYANMVGFTRYKNLDKGKNVWLYGNIELYEKGYFGELYLTKRLLSVPANQNTAAHCLSLMADLRKTGDYQTLGWGLSYYFRDTMGWDGRADLLLSSLSTDGIILRVAGGIEGLNMRFDVSKKLLKVGFYSYNWEELSGLGFFVEARILRFSKVDRDQAVIGITYDF